MLPHTQNLLPHLTSQVGKLEDALRALEAHRATQPRITLVDNITIPCGLLFCSLALMSAGLSLIILSSQNRSHRNELSSSDATRSSGTSTKEIAGLLMLGIAVAVCVWSCLRILCCTPPREHLERLVEYDQDGDDLEMNINDPLLAAIQDIRAIPAAVLAALQIQLPADNAQITHANAERYIKHLLTYYRNELAQCTHAIEQLNTLATTHQPTNAVAVTATIAYIPPQATSSASSSTSDVSHSLALQPSL